MNWPTVIVLLVVLAMVILAIRAMRMGKSQCSCGENGKKVEREVLLMVKAIDKCGKLPESLEWQIDYEWDELLNEIDRLICKFARKWEIKIP